MKYGLSKLPERISSRIAIDSESGCWEWEGAKSNGYGRVYWKGKPRPTHRVAYTLYVGEIPEGKQIDHLCANPCCMNPEHLQPVTPQVNTLRGRAIEAAQERGRRTTHCKHGHEFNEKNTYRRKNGSRACLECIRTRARERYRKKAGIVEGDGRAQGVRVFMGEKVAS